MDDEDLYLALEGKVTEGLVSKRTKGDLAIYCYTPKCQYSKAWDDVTLQARGIIIDECQLMVIARPFRKFFNLGEMPETQESALPWDDPDVVASTKYDGSLGIVYNYDGKWDIATKGAFDSEQAVYARERLLPGLNHLEMYADRTYIFEIVYPENRIVVDYGQVSSLILLSCVNRESGIEYHPGYMAMIARFIGTAAMTHDQFYSIEGLEHKPNSEGFVLHWWKRGLRVKIKSPEYIAAHRLLGEVTPKRIFELIETGKFDDVVSQLPEHARVGAQRIADALNGEVTSLIAGARYIYDKYKHYLPNRKEFAAEVTSHAPEFRPVVFRLADGRDPYETAMAIVKKSL